MSFGKMVELLQRKDNGKIILVNSGSFYIARGRDAVLLHNILNLKVNCMEAEICKIGFPLNSLEKYTQLIEQEQYSYIVYNYDNKLGKLNITKKYNGKKLNTIEEEKLNCYICKNTVKMYKKNDKYIQAVADLYEEEYQKQEKETKQNKEKNKRKKNKMETKKVKENKLQLIPKAEKYIEYILQIIIKLPRTEKIQHRERIQNKYV